jgi:hypothetical protein
MLFRTFAVHITLGLRKTHRMQSERNQVALSGASQNAEKALGAFSSPDLQHVPEDEKAAWAMAALIHCDLCRLVVALDECKVEGVARLLCLADIASKLYEARNWYNNAGAKLLRGIAERKPLGTTKVNERIERLKQEHQVHRVNKYEDYRNKFGYHYDANAIAYLQRFGNEDSDHFFELLTSFVKFSGAWAQLTKELVQSS